MKIRQYRREYSDRWDKFVAKSATGTILHSRRFLEYHGSRFADQSLLFEDANANICAALTAAADPDDPAKIVSHPGVTFGGMLYEKNVRAERLAQQIEASIKHFKGQGFEKLIYKTVPLHAQQFQSEANSYLIWKNGGELVRRDIWSVVDLRIPRRLSGGHKLNLGQAKKAGISVTVASHDEYDQFYDNLVENLYDRFGAKPTHTLAEMRDLRERFPSDIALWIATLPGLGVLAGAWMFQYNSKVWHAQYISSNNQGRELHAVSYLLEQIIQAAYPRNVDFLSLGSSTTRAGRELNFGLFDFKASLGAGSVAHDFFSIDLC